VALATVGCGGDDDDDDDADGGSAATTVAAGSLDEVSLPGTWTGDRERIARDGDRRDGSVTLVVDEQNGRTFTGTMTWTTPTGSEDDPLVGAFTPDGSVTVGADEEGTFSFRLVDAATLDFCYAETGPEHRVACARLEKQD
jgi:hypothetical protein